MNPERLETLLWERIDGTIGDTDLAELEAALAEHPEPRHLEREITRLAEQLDELPRVAPKGELKVRVAAALAEADAPARRAAEVPAAIRRSRWTEGPAAWLPLAACLVIGFAAGQLLPSIGGVAVDELKVAGTMGSGTARPGPPLSIDLGGSVGTLTVARDVSSTTIELNLAADADVMLSLEQPNGGLAVSELDGTARSGNSLSVVGGTVVLRTRGPGTSRLGVTAGNSAAPLRLELRIHGKTVVDRWIATPGIGGGS